MTSATRTRLYRAGVACPHCGERHDLCTGKAGTMPKVGDVSFCWECKKLAIFAAADGTQRKPTPAELETLMTDPVIAKMCEHVKTDADPLTAARRSVASS